MKKLLQKLLFPANYCSYVRVAWFHGIVIPWFRPSERLWQKLLKNDSFVDALFEMRSKEKQIINEIYAGIDEANDKKTVGYCLSNKVITIKMGNRNDKSL